MEWIKENIPWIITVILIIVVVFLTIKVMNSETKTVYIETPNLEREYMINKIYNDSIRIEEITINYIRYKEIAEKQLGIVKNTKKNTNEKQKEVASKPVADGIEYLQLWSTEEVPGFAR